MKDISALFTAAPGFLLWPDGSAQIETSMPQVALYTLAAVVQDAGVACTILDPLEYWRLCREGEAFDRTARGHDVFCISANSLTWPAARPLIARAAALEPRPLVVVGGLHATYCDEHVLRTTPADVVVRGEGEDTLDELLRALREGRSWRTIEGLTYLADGNVVRTPDRPVLPPERLSCSPLPLWERLPNGVYGFLPMETSRGCKFGCTFCSIYHKRAWRAVGDEAFRRRVRHTVANFTRVNIRTLMLSDDCFTADPGRVERYVRILEEEAPGIGIGIEARAGDVLKIPILKSLSRLNVEFIQIGVEAGYPEGLRRIRKGITLDQVVASAHALHRIGLRAQAKYSYIVGFPWETEVEMKRTMAFALSLGSRYGNHVQVNWHLLVPGSEIYREFREAGKVEEGDFDVLPPDAPGLFGRTHPSVTRDVAIAIQDYAELLEQNHAWVPVLGNVFRSWTRHSHLPVDRITPVAAGKEPGTAECRRGAYGEPRPAYNLPPILKPLEGRA
jgi:anaerobic magnesium-protoporphyrin IX monomethyl ester cyclase